MAVKSEVMRARLSLSGRQRGGWDGMGRSIAKGREIIQRHGQMSFYSIDLSSLHSYPSFKAGKTKVVK